MIILGYSRLGKDLEVPQGLKLGEKHQNEGCHGGDMVTSTRSEEILIYHTYFSHEKNMFILPKAIEFNSGKKLTLL